MTWPCTIAFVFALIALGACVASILCFVLDAFWPHFRLLTVGPSLLLLGVLAAIPAGLFHGVGHCPPRAPCQIEREVNTP